MPRISVIMPVYNTGKVLAETVNSVLSQTYNDFELLLIDDGSTDGSGALCDMFAQQDPRVVVIHQFNGGICAARNAGLLAAKGEYITFCDHDDLYLPELLASEIEAAEQYAADLVVVGKRVESISGVKELAPSFVFTGNEIYENLLKILGSDALGCVWNILYRKTILHGVKFNEEYKCGHEDVMFNMSVLLKTNVICALPQIGYIHIIRSNLSTSAKIHRELIPAMVDVSNKTFELIQLSKLNVEDNAKEIINVHGGAIRSCLAYALKAKVPYSEFRKIVDSLKFFPLFADIQLFNSDWKNQLVYRLLLKKKLRILFCVLLLNSLK